jgi:hypothetical protein
MKELFEKMQAAFRKQNKGDRSYHIDELMEICAKVATDFFEPQLEKWGEECASLRSEKKDLANTARDLLIGNQNQKKEINSLNEENARAFQSIEKGRELSQDQTLTIEGLRNTIAEQEEKTRKWHEQCGTANNELNQKQFIINDQKREIEEQTKRAERQAEGWLAARQQIVTLQNKVGELESNRTDLELKLQEAERLLKSSSEQQSKLLDDNKALEESVKTHKYLNELDKNEREVDSKKQAEGLQEALEEIRRLKGALSFADNGKDRAMQEADRLRAENRQSLEKQRELLVAQEEATEKQREKAAKFENLYNQQKQIIAEKAAEIEGLRQTLQARDRNGVVAGIAEKAVPFGSLVTYGIELPPVDLSKAVAVDMKPVLRVDEFITVDDIPAGSVVNVAEQKIYTPSDVARDQERRIDALKERIHELEAEKDKEWCELKGKTIREATEKIHDQENQIEELQATIRNQKNERETIVKENNALRAVVKNNFKIEWPAPSSLALAGENIELVLKVCTMAEEIKSQTNAIEAKDTEFTKALERIEELEDQLRQECNASTTNAEELGRCQSQLGEAQKQVLRLLADKEKLGEMLERGEINLAANQRELKNARSLLGDTQEERNRLASQLYRTEDSVKILAGLLSRYPS